MLYLKVEIPFCSFLIPDSREYRTSFLLPPASTVMGMLLSCVGEESYYKHINCQLFIGVKNIPEKSVVLRTCHRYKSRDINSPQNIRPDFQEILSNLDLAIAIDSSKETYKLADRINQAITNSSKIKRYSCLCLGESSHLVNSINIVSADDLKAYKWLIEDNNGDYRLPVLPYFKAGSNGMWKRFSLVENPEFII